MLNAIAKILVRAKINRDNLKREKKFLSWDKIEKIALIVDKSDASNKSQLDKFIDETKKYFEVFYIETGSREKSFGDWHCFSKKEKSFFNLPVKTVEEEIKAKKFDVVINTCNETNLFAFSICSTLKASLKCGENEQFALADLVIKRPDSLHLKNYLDETVKYLKMIRA